MELSDFVTTVFTGDVLLTGLVIGGIQEVIKRTIMAAVPKVKDTVAWKTFMASFAPILGVPMGVWIIDPTSAAPPAVLGFVAGLFASQVYDAVAPTVYMVLEKVAEKKAEKEGGGETSGNG